MQHLLHIYDIDFMIILLLKTINDIIERNTSLNIVFKKINLEE